MATARTRSSPRCCCTSQTSSVPVPEEMPSASSGLSSRSTVIAELISGSSSGKTASMTTPWISSMRPTLRFFSVCRSHKFSGQTSDSAPATTSMISWVIAAWRSRLNCSVRSLMMSPAFSEALRMAVMRAPCSDAVDSSSAR